MIVPIVWTLFEMTRTIGTIRTFIWKPNKPGFRAKAENLAFKLRMSFLLFSLWQILSCAKDKLCLHSKWTFCLAWKFRGALDFATWNLWRSVLCAKAKSSHLSDGCSGSLRHTNPHVCIAGWLVGVMKMFCQRHFDIIRREYDRRCPYPSTHEVARSCNPVFFTSNSG